MSKLTFRRQAGQPSLELGEQRLELQPEQLIDIISALTTEGSSLELELERRQDNKGRPSPADLPSDMRKPSQLAPDSSHVYSSSSQDSEVDLAPAVIRYTRSAQEHAQRVGLTDEVVREAMRDPDVEIILDSGKGYALVHGDIGLKVFLDSDTIFGVYDGDQLRRQIAEHERRSGADRRHIHGGAGGRYPTSIDEMMTVLRDLGYESKLAGSGHHKVVDSATGRSVMLPSTPSDRRSLLNTVKLVEREFGVDLRRG